MKPEAPSISFTDAMEAIEQYVQLRAYWMVKAQTLLQHASRSNRDDVNQDKLRSLCADCAKEMP